MVAESRIRILCLIALLAFIASTGADSPPIEYIPALFFCDPVKATVEASHRQQCQSKGSVYVYSPYIECFLPNGVTPTADLCKCEDNDPISCDANCDQYRNEQAQSCRDQGMVPKKLADISCSPFYSGGRYDTCKCESTCFATQADYNQWYAKDKENECFAASSLVQLTNGSRKFMKDVDIGDEVLVATAQGKLEYAKVFMFTSKKPKTETTFIRLKTSSGANLTVTPGHYLFVIPQNRNAARHYLDLSSLNAWEMRPARELNINDAVPVVISGSVRPSRIVEIDLIREVGVYMPHTGVGSIVVDSVVASEMTDFVPKPLANLATYQLLIGMLKFGLKVVPRPMVHVIAKLAAGYWHGPRRVCDVIIGQISW